MSGAFAGGWTRRHGPPFLAWSARDLLFGITANFEASGGQLGHQLGARARWAVVGRERKDGPALGTGKGKRDRVRGVRRVHEKALWRRRTSSVDHAAPLHHGSRLVPLKTETLSAGCRERDAMIRWARYTGDTGDVGLTARASEKGWVSEAKYRTQNKHRRRLYLSRTHTTIRPLGDLGCLGKYTNTREHGYVCMYVCMYVCIMHACQTCNRHNRHRNLQPRFQILQSHRQPVACVCERRSTLRPVGDGASPNLEGQYTHVEPLMLVPLLPVSRTKLAHDMSALL